MWPTKEARNAYQRKYRKTHKREHLAAVERYRKAHPEKARKWQKRYSRKLRKDVITAYGGKCALCGEVKFRKLTLDHTKGNGAAHRKRVGGWQAVYAELRKNGYPKDGFRILCRTCNIKEWLRMSK